MMDEITQVKSSLEDYLWQRDILNKEIDRVTEELRSMKVRLETVNFRIKEKEGQ